MYCVFDFLDGLYTALKAVVVVLLSYAVVVLVGDCISNGLH